MNTLIGTLPTLFLSVIIEVRKIYFKNMLLHVKKLPIAEKFCEKIHYLKNNSEISFKKLRIRRLSGPNLFSSVIIEVRKTFF